VPDLTAIQTYVSIKCLNFSTNGVSCLSC
jgi:hypothetical protein